jgi:transcriptional regulator with PAS, ATPase and Fis domain
LRDLVLTLSGSDVSVLITGESGVGKEVVARFIHAHSPRQGHPFVTINCGALPETLLESELFGHRAGSFTDAVRDRSGMFEEAEGGTILLDEIGDMSPALQVKLLRVLQDKQVRRVGENQSRRVDTRVIAATNRRLDDEVNDGNFRDDLFYRLRVVEVHIPPLRERPEDILPLARLFTQRIAGRLKLKRLQLHTSCIPALEDYDWPGNVRELENALERAAVMSDDGWIRAEQLPATVRDVAARSSVGLGSLRDIEREHVRRVLTATNGNKTQAARILGISNTTLWRKIKQDSAPG